MTDIEIDDCGKFKVAMVTGAQHPCDQGKLRVFTAICHHWMHEAPEDRNGGATWYIAELIGGAWTILFPCSAIEASKMLANPQAILDWIEGDKKKWLVDAYRESVSGSKAKKRTKVTMTDDEEPRVSAGPRRRLDQAVKEADKPADHGYDRAKEVADEVGRSASGQHS